MLRHCGKPPILQRKEKKGETLSSLTGGFPDAPTLVLLIGNTRARPQGGTP